MTVRPLGASPIAGGAAAASVREIEVFGHSFSGAATTGPAATRFAYSLRVATALGATMRDYGYGGSKVGDFATGGITAVFSAAPPNGTQGHPQFSLVNEPFGPQTQVVSLNWGVNEEDPTTERTPFINGLRSAIGFKLCAATFKANDAAVSASNFGTLQGANLVYTGDRVRGSAGAGGTLTVTAPAWWPAGRAMWVFFFAQQAVTTGTIAVTKNGSAVGTITYGPGTGTSSSYGMAAMRVPNVSAGDVVAGTVGAITGGGSVYFDRYGVEAVPHPLIVVHNVAPHGASPSDPTTMNSAIAALVAEVAAYSDRVKLLDVASVILAHYADVLADTLHPNNYGHGLIARALYDLIVDSDYPDQTYVLRAV